MLPLATLTIPFVVAAISLFVSITSQSSCDNTHLFSNETKAPSLEENDIIVLFEYFMFDKTDPNGGKPNIRINSMYPDSIIQALNNGMNPNTVFIDGNTILHKCTRSPSFIDALELAIKKGADISALNSSKEMPIHLAVINNNLACAKFLIENGSPLNSENSEGKTPLTLFFHEGCPVKIGTLLIQNGAVITEFHVCSAFFSNIKIIANDILDNWKDSFDFRFTHDYTFLHLAAVNDFYVSEVISKGADINAIDKEGCTPLHLAARHNNLNALITLLDASAIPDKPCFINSLTPLCLTKMFKCARCYRELCRRKIVDPNPEIEDWTLEHAVLDFLNIISFGYIKSPRWDDEP